MLSKGKIKFFNSLKLRKNRIKHNLFVAEGEKLVSEILKSEIKPRFIIGKKELIPEGLNCDIAEADINEIKKISSLKTPPGIVGIFEIPERVFNFDEIKTEISLFCDEIQNPGNLGTVLRTADWFGIKNVFCSVGSVDVYNPKTIQASMGATASVKVFYVKTKDFFESLPDNFPVYGTFLEGKNIYRSELKKYGIIVTGNEGKGISKTVAGYVKEKLYIPYFNPDKNTESLNVSVASAIVISEFARRRE